MEPGIKNKSSENPLFLIFVFFLIAIALSAANLFWISPALVSSFGIGAGNGAFIAIRILVLVGFTFALTYRCGRNRFQGVSLGTALGFVDQGILKAYYIYRDSVVHPEAWPGITVDAIFFNAFMGYAANFPILMLLCFFGSELGLSLRKRRLAP